MKAALISIFALGGALTLATTAHAQIVDLGAAHGQSLYVLGNAYQSDADAQGGVAIAGNFTVGDRGFSTGTYGGKLVVGGNLTNDWHSVHPDGVFVGGNLNYSKTLTSNGGVIVNGDAYIAGGQPGSVKVGGTFSYTGTETFPITQGYTASPIDFASENTFLKNQSSYLAGLSGTAVNTAGPITLNINDGLNIFNFTQAAFENSDYINFSGSTNATVVVNVAGSNVNIGNKNYFYNWVSYPDTGNFENVLFNFSEATNLSATAMGGSVLAPNATLDATYGAIFGTVVVGQLGTESKYSNIQFESKTRGSLQNVLFNGNKVPEPGTLLLAGLGLAGLVARRRK